MYNDTTLHFKVRNAEGSGEQDQSRLDLLHIFQAQRKEQDDQVMQTMEELV